MELVYLWVEKYKNIHNQGFNFSPRFSCDYDPENKELTIKDNPNYIENFFGDNINVTAIVGKNGSGKSTLMELLIILFYGIKEANSEKTNNAWIIIYDSDGKYFRTKTWSVEDRILFDKIKTNNIVLMNQIDSTTNNKQIFISSPDKHKKKYYNIVYNPAVETMSSDFLEYIYNHAGDMQVAMSLFDNKPEMYNSILLPIRNGSTINIQKNENIDILNMFKINAKLNNNIIELFSKKLNTYKLNFLPNKMKLKIDYIGINNSTITPKFIELLKNHEMSLNLEFLYKYFILLIMGYAHYDSDTKELNEFFIEDKEVLDFIKHKLEINNYDIQKTTKDLIENINDFIDYAKVIDLSSVIKKDSKRLRSDVYETAQLIQIIKHLNIDTLFDEYINDIEIIKAVLPCLPSYIMVEVEDEHGVKFNDFSYGEKRIINLIYSILYCVDFYNMKNTLINLFLDEIDLGFHPEWQKNIFDIIINIFLEYKIDIRIVLLTHSPFLLSDIPKQNIIFLDTDEEGKCKVVDGLKEKKQTFGANIHTLLSDSFFMEDGLMGEFAKGKIDKAITLLNQEHLSDEELKYCEQIISIIGEPIVKHQLQRMLDSKRLKKIDEIDAIKSSMEAMQKRLDELEK